MKINRSFFVIVLAVVMMLASCSKSTEEMTLDVTDVQNVNSESLSASTASEVADMTNSIMSNISDTKLSQTRTEWTAPDLSAQDRRLKAAVITVVGSGTKSNPNGTITIDFGTIGVTTDGVTRKGKIIVEYNGRRLQPGSYRKISFSDYYRNAIALSGSCHRFVSDSAKTSTDLKITFKDTTAINLTFPDSTDLTRTTVSTVAWDYVIATPAQSTVTHKANSTATGTTRKGAAYATAVTADLVFPASCLTTGYELPQSGSKTLTVTAAGTTTHDTYTFNFGSSSTSGACTKQVVIQHNGKTETVASSSNGN